MEQHDLQSTNDSYARRLILHWSGPSSLLVVYVALAAWTWRKWPDLLVDFGRELYIPWQLGEGAVLYRDMAYFNGPFSPYFNALLFRGFGVSFSTLIAVNAILLALLTCLLYRWIARLLDRLTATMTCLVLLCVFGFAHLMAIGNYNYIAPYSHELTHGVLLSLIMLQLITGREGPMNWVRMAAAGICLGIVFLGKAEIFLAAAGAAIVALGLWCSAHVGNFRQRLSSCLIFFASALFPATLFIAALAGNMPLQEASIGVAGSWQWVMRSDAISQHYYRSIAGLDYPLENLVLVLQSTLLVVLIVAAAFFCDRWKNDRPRRSYWAIGAAVCFAAVLFWRKPILPCLLDAKALLPLGLVITGWLWFTALRHRDDQRQFVRHAPLACWAVFSLLLLSKLLLLPRIHHYGFVLAMPVVVLVVAFLVGYLPRLLSTQTKSPSVVFRCVMIAALLLDISAYLQMSADKVNRKTYQVASGPDRIASYNIQASPVAPAVAQALHAIEAIMPPDATFAALPEGIMLNYLSRRRNPTGYVNLMPPELAMFSEEAILLALRTEQPDYILLVHKDTSEYGVKFFGSPGYGEQILGWVKDHYQAVQTIGHQPFRDDRFGIEILKRCSSSSHVSQSSNVEHFE